jgi:predicted secreted protein
MLHKTQSLLGRALTGRHDGEVAFDLSLDSAGELTFTAA